MCGARGVHTAWDPATDRHVAEVAQAARQVDLTIDTLVVTFAFPFTVTLCADRPGTSVFARDATGAVRVVNVDPHGNVSFSIAPDTQSPADALDKVLCHWEPIFSHNPKEGRVDFPWPILAAVLLPVAVVVSVLCCMCCMPKQCLRDKNSGSGHAPKPASVPAGRGRRESVVELMRSAEEGDGGAGGGGGGGGRTD